MKKYLIEGVKLALFGGLVFTITILLYSLYEWRIGGPMLW